MDKSEEVQDIIIRRVILTCFLPPISEIMPTEEEINEKKNRYVDQAMREVGGCTDV